MQYYKEQKSKKVSELKAMQKEQCTNCDEKQKDLTDLKDKYLEVLDYNAALQEKVGKN